MSAWEEWKKPTSDGKEWLFGRTCLQIHSWASVTSLNRKYFTESQITSQKNFCSAFVSNVMFVYFTNDNISLTVWVESWIFSVNFRICVMDLQTHFTCCNIEALCSFCGKRRRLPPQQLAAQEVERFVRPINASIPNSGCMMERSWILKMLLNGWA